MRDETQLIKLAKRGDISAFEELISTHEKMVFNYCYRMCGNLHDAEDLAQEIFLKAYRGLGRFQGNSQFSTWIYKIAYNTCIDAHRKKKPIHENMLYPDDDQEYREIVSDAGMPEDELLLKEKKEMVQTCIDVLRPEYRSVIVLRDIQDHSYKEIAKILEIPLGTVKSYISRGRLALRECLKSKL